MTSVKGWHTGRLWSMTLSASLRTVIVYFSLLFSIAMLLVSVPLILLFPLIIVSFSPSVFLFRCVLHPLSLPLSLCLGCTPPLIGLPSLRFMRLPLVCFFCLCVFIGVFYFIATISFAGYFLVRSLLSVFPAYLRFPV